MDAIAYIDESGDHNLANISPHSPVLTIASVILESAHLPLFEQRLNALKVTHFGSDQVVLHSRDIRKQQKDFSCLRDPAKREAFNTAFNEFFTVTPCTVISITIHKERLVQCYSQPDNPYQLALLLLLERITHWSRHYFRTLAFGAIELLAESRGKVEDKQLKDAFDHVRTVGTRYMKPENIQRACQSLHMEKKAMNIPGLQLADMLAYPLARRAIGKADPRTMAVIEPKLYGGLFGNIESYGAKVFPPAPHMLITRRG